MALPWIYLLPPSARLASSFVQAGVKRGLSSRAIERTIRDAGLSISRTRSILPMMRQYQRIERQGQNIRFVAKGNTINVNKLPESITRLRRQFSYNVRVVGTDSFGNPVDRFVTVSTDSRTRTPAEIEAAAEQMVSEEGQSATVINVTATLQSGVRQADSIPVL